MSSGSERNAAFYDELAANYDAHLTGPSDKLARMAFQDLVSRHVLPGSILLDFGCGTGLDALAYAQKGHRVLAYDNSAGMMAELRRRCEQEIAAGKILPYAADYGAFLKHWPNWPAPHAVVANFGVLNSIRDLNPLFETFAQHLAPPGDVIVSILNPVHWTKISRPDWWRQALRSRGQPVTYTTEPYVSYLHFIPAVLAAAPQFELVGRANAGALVRYAAVSPAEKCLWWGREAPGTSRGVRALWQTPVYQLLGHFVFLVLRRVV